MDDDKQINRHYFKFKCLPSRGGEFHIIYFCVLGHGGLVINHFFRRLQLSYVPLPELYYAFIYALAYRMMSLLYVIIITSPAGRLFLSLVFLLT